MISRSGGGCKLYDLGTAKTFDIKTLAPNIDYTKLTADNFFMIGLTSGDSGDRAISATTMRNRLTETKTYDATTGVLTWKETAQCTTNGNQYAIYEAPVHAYLIVKPKIA